jgi:hypothetical protein
MWVAEEFEGDPIWFAWKQHDSYPTALGVILNGVRKQYLAACCILAVQPSNIGERLADHRALQRSHDILAAAFRFRRVSTNHDLFEASPTRANWIAWLSEEVAAWWDDPCLIRDSCRLLKAGPEPDYDAERDLERRLYDRFLDVPWKHLDKT